jgi:hypothetical protein
VETLLTLIILGHVIWRNTQGCSQSIAKEADVESLAFNPHPDQADAHIPVRLPPLSSPCVSHAGGQ